MSATETASYSRDLLNGLRLIATKQKHYRLAELLDAAAAEAERLSTGAPVTKPSRK